MVPTITSKCVVKEMVKRDGRYAHGPQALAIFEYTVGAGIIKRWFVAYNEADLAELHTDPNLCAVRELWHRSGGGA